MKTYRFNGELWYVDDRPLWCRVRRWLVTVGLRELKNGRLASEGEITPLTLWGGLVTFFGHWFQLRTPWGWLVVVFKRDAGGKATREVERAYISATGTPGHAHTWLVGTPPEIVKHVERRAVA